MEPGGRRGQGRHGSRIAGESGEGGIERAIDENVPRIRPGGFHAACGPGNDYFPPLDARRAAIFRAAGLTFPGCGRTVTATPPSRILCGMGFEAVAGRVLVFMFTQRKERGWGGKAKGNEAYGVGGGGAGGGFWPLAWS